MAFGFEPIYAPVILPHAPADFIFTRVLENGEVFPEDTTAWIKWATGEQWDAELVGGEMTFRVESEDHETIANATPYKLFISYPDGGLTADYEWFYGHASRRG
jgi:hypothetical protein